MQKQNGSKSKTIAILIIEVIVIILLVIAFIFFRSKEKNSEANNDGNNSNQIQIDRNDNIKPTPTLTAAQEEEKKKEEEAKKLAEEEKKLEEERAALVAKANHLALTYDYDKAIDMIKSYPGNYEEFQGLNDAISSYEESKKNLVKFGAYNSVEEISHIFFHSLIADTSLAFDGDYDSNGYNYYMTTVDETIAMFEEMYANGYVLVSIHDVAKKVTGEDGVERYVPGDIMLPADKKPFVMSQDDTNYYDYMDGDGFATRGVIDENGRPSTEMLLADGTTVVGDFDLVPVLETFLEKHPDFSYRGARGILAITGYEGTLGYRTDDKSSPTYEADREKVKEVAKVYKEWGWEFASHSYGHRNMTNASYQFTVTDTNRWLEEVGQLVGPTDLYIFPYGADIEDTLGNYESDKYKFLKDKGFDYFCGVYARPWIHVKNDYVRMTRRPLDGQAMLQFPERLTDLFEVDKVVDKSRPALK